MRSDGKAGPGEGMHVGLFHNYYAQRGGEDAVFDRELELLGKAGCVVNACTVDSGDAVGPAAAVRAAWQARASRPVAQRVMAFVRENPVELGHVHNFFPLLTPSVHETLFRLGVPIVQTLHNYRLVCAHGGFLRDGRSCEDCVTRGPWNAVRHGCWRGSRAATAVWADVVHTHRRWGTWERVAAFVAPSAFAREKLVEAGLPAERLHVIPNPVEDPGAAAGPGQGAVYVGRLSQEKGVSLLLEAWRALPDVPLTVVGDGPLMESLTRAATDLPNVVLVGAQPRERVARYIADAAFLVAPSLCYETFGLAAAEALAAGRPVVVPQRSALAELAGGGRSGLLFEPGDSDDLARACRRLAADATLRATLGAEGRATYEDALAPESRTEALLDLYRRVLSERRS